MRFFCISQALRWSGVCWACLPTTSSSPHHRQNPVFGPYPMRRGRSSRSFPYSRPSKVPQISEPCMIYTRTGKCDQRPGCRYQHQPGRTAICQQFIKTGRCSKQGAERCYLSHNPRPENAPMCVHFARGHCAKRDCPFAHMTQLGSHPEQRPTCRKFAINGWCDRGLNCTKRHSFDCPDFEAYGKCPNPACTLQHVIKANALAEAKEGNESRAAPGTLSKNSEMVNVSDFIQFLKEATRESCNTEYLPNHDSHASGTESTEDSSESESDWGENEVDETPLDTGADFISI